MHLFASSRETFGSIRTNLKTKQKRLKVIQAGPPNADLRMEEAMLKEQTDRLLEIEEEKWRKELEFSGFERGT